MHKRTVIARLLVLLPLLALARIPAAQVSSLLPGSTATPRPLVGSTAALLFHYERWKQGLEPGTVPRLGLSLGWSKGRSVLFTRSRGQVVVDLSQGTLEVTVSGIEDEALGGSEVLDVWLEPWHEAGQAAEPVLLGEIAIAGGAGSVRAVIDVELARLELDGLVLARPGAGIEDGGVLFAVPELFQRLVGFEISRLGPLRGRHVGGLPLAPPVANPAAPGWTVAGLDELVADGERLFFEETFAGNGRSCGTCHPAENNFTLDPQFIAGLPADDPLFVAETVPALDATRNGGLVFESPVHMRRFGLIVENLDGFEDLARRFVLRAVQPTTALAATIEPLANSAQTLRHRTGWGGDGAPGRGSLREFALGAVRQHFPRTLARRAGVDFRLPTPRELSALEAFQLSLGRREDPDLAAMVLRDGRAQRGKQPFFFQGLCHACHQNGGGNTVGGLVQAGAALIETGVEALEQASFDGTGLTRPVDGGFGTQDDGGFAAVEPGPEGGFGSTRFNVPSLIELADTLPAFHSHVTANPGAGLANTVEGAVEFYRTQAFIDSEVGGGAPILQLSDRDVDDLGRLLRVLNALENVRVASEYVERARDEVRTRPRADSETRIRRLIRLARAENEDLRQVLSGVGLHPGVQQESLAIEETLRHAATANSRVRLVELERVRLRLQRARSRMVAPTP